MFCESASWSFLLLSNISLYGYTTICLSIRFWWTFRLLPRFCLLQIKFSRACLCVGICCYFCGVDTWGWNVWAMWKVENSLAISLKIRHMPSTRPKVVELFNILSRVDEASSCSTSSPTLVMVSTVILGVYWYFTVFSVCISLRTSYVQNFFMSSFPSHTCFLVKCLLISYILKQYIIYIKAIYHIY